jgi:heat shock protein HtpX
MQQIAKTTLLLSLMTGLFLAVGFMLGGRAGAMTALLFAAVTNFGMYWFSDKVVLAMQGAKPLDEAQFPQVRRIVQELATADNLPMPKLYMVNTPIPNAFATGRSPRHAAVAVTSGIMRLLSDKELKAVLGHELGHVKNRDMLVSTIAATVAGAISFLVQMAMWSNLFGGNDDDNNNPVAAVALIILAPLAAMLIQMAVSRSREYLADQHGAKVMGSGKDLASALQKLEDWKHDVPAEALVPSPTQNATAHLMFANMFSAQGLSAMFSTHPSTEDRIARLMKY